jgi:hypothetical protein
MLLRLIRRARLRLIYNDLLAQGANAFCAGLFAFILLLLLGTQILEWQWAALIPVAAAGFGLFRTWRRAPDSYAAAQVVDRELALADTLSTALFFGQTACSRRADEDVRIHQFEQAERLAASVDVRRATPYHMPRVAYAAAALFLVASSLFALRYGLTRQLDLRPPLASILQDSMGSGRSAEQAPARKKNGPKAPGFANEKGLALSGEEKNEAEQALQNALQRPDMQEVQVPSSDAKAGIRAKSEDGDQMAGSDEEADSESLNASSGDAAGEGQQGPGQSKDGQKSAAKPKQEPGSGDSSLMQKLKDAMQNLLAKMKQQPAGEQRQEGSQTAQKGKQGKQQGAGKQNAGKGQKQQEGGQEGESQEGQSEPSESAQANPSKGSSQSQNQPSSKQPGSGIGKNDGQKDLKLAEQMAAMGKLSEIIGKRSANVSGEAMVEVRNSNQQLSTRYEARRAAHGAGGGEISRDEVPVALEGYVAEYFEQARKAQGKSQSPKGKSQK